MTDRKGRVLTVRYGAEVVAGELGRRLDLAQAAAIRDVLAYLADKRRESEDDAERDSASESVQLSDRAEG